MSTQRHLKKAPIREAILDFGFPRIPGIEGSSFEKFKTELSQKFPISMPIQILESQFQLNQSNAEIKPFTRHINGTMFKGSNEALQFKLDGFSFHRLSPYNSWEDTLESFRTYWELYCQTVTVERLIRIGVRYINAISLQWDPDVWNSNLSAPPAECFKDPDAKQFLSRAVYKDDAKGIQSTVVQSLDKQPNNMTSIILDINTVSTFREGRSPNDPEIWTALNSMRSIKNKYFFELLREPLIKEFE